MLRFCFLMLLITGGASSFAQSTDTTYLKEVSVYGVPFASYATGSKVAQIKTGTDIQTLSEKLIDETSLYLKTYGNSQLSTISMRGTTASQTAVLWNGMNVNSPTLGQTDFSIIPLFLFDEVSIRYGTASSLYGTDAIGGSIMLGQGPVRIQPGTTWSALLQTGSFGRLDAGLKFQTAFDKWELRTKIYRSFIENDFPYESPAVGYSKKQNNASVLNYGIGQQVYYKIGEHQQISLDGLYVYNFREIQPAVTNDQGDETLKDSDTRIALKYFYDASFGTLSAVAGFVSSDQDYTNDVTSNVRSRQLNGQVQMEQPLNPSANVRYGISYSNYQAWSENFINDLSENRIDAFASFKQAITNRWIVNLNLRQSFYEHGTPFAPAIGSQWNIGKEAGDKVLIRMQAGRGFRIPTLNDRYWMPGGNPELKSEDAIHLEGGMTWSALKDRTSYSVDVSTYATWADDMIVWLSGDDGIWSPTNLQKVNIFGVEGEASASFKLDRSNIRATLVYGYVQSVNQKGLNEFDQSIVGKQLPYTPVHNARASASWKLSSWQADVRLNYTGIRYTQLDNAQWLEAYALLDASLSKTFDASKVKLRVRGEVQNIMNVYYENLRNRAMPGRNYLITLTANLNRN